MTEHTITPVPAAATTATSFPPKSIGSSPSEGQGLPTGGNIRKLWSAERDKLTAHLLRLDRESRRLRFAHGVSDDFIRGYVDGITDFNSIVYTFVEGGEVRAAAELRKTGDAWGKAAECAFTVEADLQNHGLGSELMGRVIRAARNRGVEQLHMCCLAENSRMQRIARRHQAMLRYVDGEMHAEIVPSSPSALSVMEEAIDDQRGYVLTILDLQSRMLPTAAA